MDMTQGLWYMLGWFLLRFGLPIVATVMVCWLFRRLDERWRAQAEETRKQAVAEGVIPIIRCWLLNDCPEEKRGKCAAYLQQDIPCWQHFRAKNGELKDGCIGCGVFRGAPAPAIGD